MARDAMEGLIEVMVEHGEDIPESDPADAIPRFARLAQMLRDEGQAEPIFERLAAELPRWREQASEPAATRSRGSLQRSGFAVVRVAGSHYQLYNEHSRRHVTVPYHNRDSAAGNGRGDHQPSGTYARRVLSAALRRRRFRATRDLPRKTPAKLPRRHPLPCAELAVEVGEVGVADLFGDVGDGLFAVDRAVRRPGRCAVRSRSRGR